MNKQLLIIDDDNELVELLSEYLGSEGYDVTSCLDGLSGLEQAKKQSYDLILLDVMMPGLNGFEVLKALGDNFSTPVLMLTAKDDDYDKILGLELGADDYLSKPYNPKELLARIKAIIRRIDIISSKSNAEELLINQIELNCSTRQVMSNKKPVSLTGTEFEILHLLMSNVNQVVSKEQLSEEVLHRPISSYDRSIDMHISNIRRKIGDNGKEEKIKTIRAVGYIFMRGDS
ncbi:response regulator transcription factor [Thalassotalea crassostreae]|uniref:response regulator transcription factor n=1 Tax=Thalassotalea crassostreae TaxID=1763536 RepID=UPI000837DC0D|nr:response regulator transcription factor [Thalassotalea crassostreae]